MSWIVIVAWVLILGGVLGASRAFGGTYVNNYTVSGSDSALGLDRLNSEFKRISTSADFKVQVDRMGLIAIDSPPPAELARSRPT